jgi:hypothetical protein
MTLSTQYTVNDLPGLDCGVCGMRSCEELAARLQTNPELVKRCIYLSDDRYEAQQTAAENQTHPLTAHIAPNPQRLLRRLPHLSAALVPVRSALARQPGADHFYSDFPEAGCEIICRTTIIRQRYPQAMKAVGFWACPMMSHRVVASRWLANAGMIVWCQSIEPDRRATKISLLQCRRL